jgi:multisubunit Na+/H+ antiporter MnhE subunit
LPYVALGNDLTALAAVVWLALAQGFSTAGTVVVIGAVIGLFVLSTLQARAMLAGRHRLAAGRPR